MNRTSINWPDPENRGRQLYTWNVVFGCSPISESCQNCYARSMAKRFPSWGSVKAWDGTLQFIPKRLYEPLVPKRSVVVFVCSMGDIFHENVELEWMQKILSVIIDTPQHTYMMLTKRPENIKKLFKNLQYDYLDHLWLGITAENQAWYNERWPLLAKAWPGKKFVSAEPLLGEIRLVDTGARPQNPRWIIAGPETGPGARKYHIQWKTRLEQDCKNWSVNFHWKGAK